MTRRTIKDNLTVKVSKLANRHKAHGEARHIENRGYREGTGVKMANGGYRKRGVVSNANAGDMCGWAAACEGSGIRGHIERLHQSP